MLAHGLEHRDDVAFLLGLRMDAGQDRAAVDEHRRPVEARQGHHAAGHVLVAAADRHDRVKALGAGDRLDRIGDDFARNHRVAHARRAHADAVGDGDRAENDRLAAGWSAPAAASRANWSMCMLHGVTMLQVEAMPTTGLAKSASAKPTARSMDRLGARSAPSSRVEEYLRSESGEEAISGRAISSDPSRPASALSAIFVASSEGRAH